MVDNYACSTQSTRTQILAWHISKTPILSIHSHSSWHFWCRGMRVWCATLDIQFLALRTSNTHHSRYPKTPLLAFWGQMYARLMCCTGGTHCLALHISNTHILPKYQTTLLLAFLVQICVCSAHDTASTHSFKFRILNRPILSIKWYICWHFWCRGMCVRRARLETHFFGTAHFKDPRTIVFLLNLFMSKNGK